MSRARDRFDAGVSSPHPPAVDLAPLVGRWVNFDDRSTGIASITLAERHGELVVRTLGAGSPAPSAWGEVVGKAFTDGVGLGSAVGFRAIYVFGFARVMLASYLNRRLLVVDAYTVFLDGSGRSNYFQRDHFYL